MFIDDVYSGGKRDASSGNTYPLLSEAIKSGLFHPNCKDSTSTYYEGITTLQPVTEEEQAEMERREQLEQRQSYYENQAKKNRRIAEYSLDADNKRTYSHRAEMFEQKAQNAEKALANSGETGIILTNIDSTVANGLHYVGTIDKKLYSCVTKDISTDELIITEKQIEHIFKNHPTDFIDVKDVIWSVREAVSSPDYIVESEKPNTAFVLKELSNEKGKSRLIMRLKTSTDPDDYKNSIITFQKTREKEWNRIIRNKKILYKKE